MRSSTIVALLGGAALGVAIGILFAPDKGEVTRKKYKKIIEDEYDELKDKVTEKGKKYAARLRREKEEAI